MRRQSGLEENRFWEAVREQGFTDKQYREDVRKQLLRLKVINQRVRSRVNISEETVRETYDDRVRQGRRTQRFNAAHIFFPLPETASATAVADVTSTRQSGRRSRPSRASTSRPRSRRRRAGCSIKATCHVLRGHAAGPHVGEMVRRCAASGVHIFLVRERQASKDTVGRSRTNAPTSIASCSTAPCSAKKSCS